MNKLTLILVGIVAFFLVIFSFSGCERIDAGHVGVKVNLYGDGKGVDDVTEVTGWVFYNPISTKIIEFPTFVQHKEYRLDKEKEIDESFVVNSKDGSEFHVSPLLNYSVKREKVPFIFSKYRVTLGEIEAGFLKTAVYDAFRVVANSYTADELISNRELFEIKVRKVLEDHLLPEGFILAQFTSNLVYPETFKKAIEAKNNAVQSALTAENKVKQAEAEANRLKQQTITPMLLQLEWINKWNGKMPETMLGQGQNVMLGLPK